MKKFFIAYFIFAGIPLALMFTDIISPEVIGYMILAVMLSCLIVGMCLVFYAIPPRHGRNC